MNLTWEKEGRGLHAQKDGFDFIIEEGDKIALGYWDRSNQEGWDYRLKTISEAMDKAEEIYLRLS